MKKYALYNTELGTYFFFGTEEECQKELEKLQEKSKDEMIDCNVEVVEVDLNDDLINSFYELFLNGEDIV